MMKCCLFEEFKRYEGQPVKIFTDDRRVHCGIDLHAFEDHVRILDDCGRTVFIEYSHIDAVVEPMMRLRKCCKDNCDCDRHQREDDEFDGDRDRERECEEREEFGERGRYR